MSIRRKIEVFGDSILRGIQINPLNNRYHIDNRIDVSLLENRFDLDIENRTKFGCTVTKGEQLLNRYLEESSDCAAVIMNFGGNDCDYNWAEIARNPDGVHEQHTPIQKFVQTYTKLIHTLQEKAIYPIVANLPPLCPQRFFNWFCKDLNKENVLRFLDSINAIYRVQEYYSHTVEEIARTTGALFVDIRGTFLKRYRIEHFLCADGIHINTEGQGLITEAFVNFAAVNA